MSFAYRLVLLIVLLASILGCTQTRFIAYRPPGSDVNLDLEILRDGRHYTLMINNAPITTMSWAWAYHLESEGTYKGEPVIMKGEFLAGRGTSYEIFISGKKVAQFDFP